MQSDSGFRSGSRGNSLFLSPIDSAQTERFVKLFQQTADPDSETGTDPKERIDMIDTLAGLGLGKRAYIPSSGDDGDDDAWENDYFQRAIRSRNRNHWHMLRFGRR